MVSPQLPRPDTLGMTHGTHHHTDTRKPDDHHRFSRRSHLLPPDDRWQGVCRMGPCLRPDSWFSTQAPGNLSWGRVSHTPLALQACPSRWDDHLEDTVYDMQNRVYGPPTLPLTLSC